MEVKVKMEYQNELKKLEEGGNFWKPKPGQYKVKTLTELEDTNPYIRKSKIEGQPDEVNPQAKVKILVNGEEKTWSFGKGATLASTYGQLVKLATNHGNSLTNVEFSVVVKSDGVKNDYTIVE